MHNSLPPTFAVTKRWDMHSSEYKITSDVQARMKQYATKKGINYSEKTTATSLSAFLNKIKFIYVPAIKDEHVFNETLNILQQSLFASKNKRILDEPIGHANEAVQEIISELQKDFEESTGIPNFVELPTTLNYTNGLLQINTTMNVGSVTIDKRGDGIRTHYIPKILNYVACRSKDIFIWGFEEPENSYEYRRCLQVAKEFDEEYCKNSQIFITSHSPAFFNAESEEKSIFCIGMDKDKTVLLSNSLHLDEELGYIELYRKFITQIEELENRNHIQAQELKKLNDIINSSNTPIILTEGKTDAQLLKLAIAKLNLTIYSNWAIRQIVSEKTSNNETLLKFLQELSTNVTNDKLIIGIFDRDTELKINLNGEVFDMRDKEFVKLAKSIYAFSLPVPYSREQVDQISIEHYFLDAEIKTPIDNKRLFLANEFYTTGVHKQDSSLYYKSNPTFFNTIKIIEHETKNYVTKVDGTGDYSISKARFVECIEENLENFSDISFSEFSKIFDVIDKIYTDYANEN